MLTTSRHFVLPLFLLFFLLQTATARAEWLREEREAMGTSITVELWTEDAAAGRAAMAAVFAEFNRLDLMMNPWNPSSELSRINREAATGPVTTTGEILEVVARAAHYSRLTGGAFDISFASVAQHYDYREGEQPSQQERASGRANIDYRAIVLDEDAGTISFGLPGLQIDLGGIAKGYAVDRGIALLSGAGIEAGVVSAGGDSRILGDRGDRPRTVGIRHPRKEGEFAVLIPLADTAISTSGDYERFFITDGVRHHHILDPTTGDSARKVQSASILAPRAIDSDALSTAVFVLGVREGLALVNSLPGVDAIIIDGAGKLHYSDELLRSVESP
ncbi:MAG: FAD:protein FMN transferase [Halioglobus sp.]|nr:FAD:protein FMN transferase [Halioglobus sp.]